MTDRFIDNFTPGSGGDGLSWANAELTAAAVDAADAAGDRWLFDYRHSESTAGAVTLAVAGTLASPSQLLSVTQSGGAGVSSLTAGAIISTTGANALSLTGNFYAFGLNFQSGSSSFNANLNCGTSSSIDRQVYEDCTLHLSNTSTNSRISLGGGSQAGSSSYEWVNCIVRFGSASQFILVASGQFVWRGGGLSASGTDPTYLLNAGARPNRVLLEGLDLSEGATGMNLFATSGNGNLITIRNCKLPASWSGSLWNTVPTTMGARAEMYNCSASDTNYALWVEDYAGSIKHETTRVKTGGASDGTTPLSWVMASSANAEYPAIILRSPEIQKWNETTGSAITVTVDFLHDSATNLQDDEIWLEVEYLGTSGFPLAVFADDAVADVIATPADQTTSAATWTTTGMANPNEQKLSVTFTPQEKGLIIARVCVGLASKTVYIDPVLQVS
jgi:hypothetical protein